MWTLIVSHFNCYILSILYYFQINLLIQSVEKSGTELMLFGSYWNPYCSKIPGWHVRIHTGQHMWSWEDLGTDPTCHPRWDPGWNAAIVPGGWASLIPPGIKGGIPPGFPGGIGGIPPGVQRRIGGIPPWIPGGIGGISPGITGGIPPGTFHNPDRDPRWDPARKRRDPTWD